MKKKASFLKGPFSFSDGILVLVTATIIYGVFSIANESQSDFHPATQIDLSVWRLPYYTLLSAVRGTVAYFISLIFTFIVGYLMARFRLAERWMLPLLDIFQSIPVLGFLPGLILGLVAFFPKTNTGLELAAILMIFTGQVWNMTFSYYASLKSLPRDLDEASRVLGFGIKDRLLHLELPYSAVNLAWNSLLSMAGGWFFLIPCEAMTLGDKEYRLPGIGAYMDVAISQKNPLAIGMAVIAMLILIIAMDFVVWRPVLSWVRRYRLDESISARVDEPLMRVWLRESPMLRLMKLFLRRFFGRLKRPRMKISVKKFFFGKKILDFLNHLGTRCTGVFQVLGILCLGALLVGMSFKAYYLFMLLIRIPGASWLALWVDAAWTLFRVFLVLVIATAMSVPLGIWIGTSAKRVRIAQPIIQVLASFPAPMLYPLVLGLLFALSVPFSWASVILMLLGVQWYVLFNVLAGAMSISQTLNDAAWLMDFSRWDRWKFLYFPSIFPSLATAWITAAGGAWNASVVSEYLSYQGHVLQTRGLGAKLSSATVSGDFSLFAASLVLIVFIVFSLNRWVWSKIYAITQRRYRIEL
jgi:NitT/TauT family transport system permease protein